MLQVERVQAAYSNSFDQLQHMEENSWALLTGMKR